MKWLELKVGIPALVYDSVAQEEYELIKTSMQEAVFRYLRDDYYNSVNNGFFDPDLIDWINEEGPTAITINTQLCTCDLYSQLMPYGCKCGGQ